MSEEITRNLPDKRSFEERVLARFDAFDLRFDAIDARFDSIDIRFDSVDARFESVNARFESIDGRLEKLESRNYDTKPIWERALKAIMETGLEVGELKTKVDGIETKVGVIETKVELLQNEIETIKTSIRNELVDVRRALKHNVGDRLDMIHKVLLDNRDDIRDAEDRIRGLESKLA